MKRPRVRPKRPDPSAIVTADPAYPVDARRHQLDVVYQGVRGAFSEEAARRLLGNVEATGLGARLAGLPTLSAILVALQSGHARYAVVPVHNSIAGSVPGADAIFRLDGARIEAQLEMPIEQCLVAPKGTRLAGLRRIVSHPMAIGQCRMFLDARPWIRIERHADTAGALAWLIESSATDAAAIASERAAEIWGGTVLERSIQDGIDNRTTFVMVSGPAVQRT